MEEVKKQGVESLFVPYEIALALKELGFEEPCFGFYDDMENNKPIGGNFPCDGRNSAPLYQQAFKFLLDVIDDIISITYFFDGSGNLNRVGEGVFFNFNNREDCLIELINQAKLKKQ
jgi:hypothetical protein